MAKDILIDTNSGSLIYSDRNGKAQYFDVVWGRLFDGDDQLFMNIVVPYKYINQLRYDENGEFFCRVHADYCPETSYFLARLVTQMSSTGKYIKLDNNGGATPLPSEALYYPTFTGVPQSIKASQLQLVDKDGYFSIVFKRYNQGTYVRAIICQGGELDFKIGDSDSQSAQLLGKCAPGKFYRFPTSGVDLTKYINSVVDHTSLKDELVSEFQKDFKSISEASFDNTNGELNIVLTGANEADDGDLDDPSTLDLELMRVSTDEFVRTLYKASQGMLADNAGFTKEMMEHSDKLVGIWDIGGECKLESIEYRKSVGASKSRINRGGLSADSAKGYMVSSVNCRAGVLYALNYVGQKLPLDEGYNVDTAGHKAYYGQWDALVMFQDDNEGEFVDDNFYTTDYTLALQYQKQTNRPCFIPLVDCTGFYYAGSEENDLNLAGCGLRPVSYEEGNLVTILGIMVHPTTGKIYGVTSVDSVIDEVRIDLKTSQLFVIKHSKE